MNTTKAKIFGTAILALVIILAGCSPEVSNIQMRRGVKADGNVGSGGPPVTNQTLTAPTGVTTAVLSTGRIRVSWNAVPGATSYRVYYGEPNEKTMKYYVIVTAPATSWEDNDALDKGHTYYYQVQAVNATGEGPLSSAYKQEFTSTPTTPTTPTEPPAVSNPFLGTWRSVTDSSHTFVFSDHSVTNSWRYDGHTYSYLGSYSYSGNHATLTFTDPEHPGVYTADITGSNSLKMTYQSGIQDDFTKQ
jgi:hypothetical protein